MPTISLFYSHVNYSVTKIVIHFIITIILFYSHVNYSVTKILVMSDDNIHQFYSHVNYSVTKMRKNIKSVEASFTVT